MAAPITQKTKRVKRNDLNNFFDTSALEDSKAGIDLIDTHALFKFLSDEKTTDYQKEFVEQLVDTVLSITKQKEFISYGEKIALNTLRRLGILLYTKHGVIQDLKQNDTLFFVDTGEVC
jgi:hypothetical protein